MEMKLPHAHGFKSQNTAFFRTSMSVSWWTWAYEHLLATTDIRSYVTDIKVLFIMVQSLLQQARQLLESVLIGHLEQTLFYKISVDWTLIKFTEVYP
jgi:hypothetical protein